MLLTDMPPIAKPSRSVAPRLGRLVLLVLILLGSYRVDSARGRDSRRPVSSYRVLFEDGSKVTGKTIDRWENYKSTSVSGKRLFDGKRPVRFVRDLSRNPASVGARIVMFNGDVLPGRVIGVERAEDTPGRPVCLRVMPAVRLRNGRAPKAGIPIRPGHVSSVIAGIRLSGKPGPDSILLQNGSVVSCQAMKWTSQGLSVLTDTGTRTFKVTELVHANMPQTDAIARILDDALGPCPQRDGLIATLVTVGGARLTFRPSMMRIHEKQLAIQPVWSLSAILLPTSDVCRLSVRRYDEVPLSMLPADTLAQKAFTGFVWPWRRNRSVRGGPLGSGALAGDLGVGTHAYSAIAFHLPQGAESFSFNAGLDRRVGTGGCVRLKVAADKIDAKPLWNSGIIRGGNSPVSVKSLNCRNAKRLVLITEFAHKGRPAGADPYDIRDEVNWIMPTVKMNSAEMVRHYGRTLRYFAGLSGWTPAGRTDGNAPVSTKWDNTDVRWRSGLDVRSSGLSLTRKVRVTYSALSLWASGLGRDGSQKISLWVADKQIKCADRRGHLSTGGEPRAARWSLKSHLGKDVILTLKIQPGDPRRASSLIGPDIWFTREPVIVPTSRSGLVTWRYVTKEPAKGWTGLKFDDSSWARGPGMFAGKGEAGMRTEWPTKDIWIRRSFNLPEVLASDMLLTVRHDDAAEVYLNGVLAAVFPGASYEGYAAAAVLPAAKAALKVGKNVIAVHCNDEGGRRYIDVGLIDSTQSAGDDPHIVSRRIRYMPELADGMVRVLGKHARISGGSARFDRELNAIARWWRGKTWFSWDANAPRAGKYVVQLTYGCLSRAAGSTYEVSVGDQKVRGVVRATGRWATFTTDDVGVIELKNPGATTINVRLVNTPGNGIMTLHAVTLVPVK